MKTYIISFKSFYSVLFVLLLYHATLSTMHAADKIWVKNVRFEPFAGEVIIYYDLIAPIGKEYKISVLLRRDRYPSFSLKPKMLSGNIGKGHFAGRNRQIIWEISRELPRRLEGSDYHFVVNAEMVSGSKSLFWIGTSTAVLSAGGIAAYLFLFKKNGDSAWPVPPGRPPQ